MKKSFYLFILLLNIFYGYSQDIIYKSSTDSILSKIIEVNIDNVKYKKYSNLDGPLYTINKSEIDKIVYENGDVDDFKKEKKKTVIAYATVYVIRPKTTSSWFNGMKIYEDEKIIGVLSSDTYLTWKIKVDSGEISISSRGEGTDTLRILPVEGKTYYIKQSHKTGWVKARPKLEFIGEVEAKKLLNKSKPAESKFTE